MANVVTTHMAFSKDEIKHFIKNEWFSRHTGWVISSKFKFFVVVLGTFKSRNAVTFLSSLASNSITPL